MAGLQSLHFPFCWVPWPDGQAEVFCQVEQLVQQEVERQVKLLRQQDLQKAGDGQTCCILLEGLPCFYELASSYE